MNPYTDCEGGGDRGKGGLSKTRTRSKIQYPHPMEGGAWGCVLHPSGEDDPLGGAGYKGHGIAQAERRGQAAREGCCTPRGIGFQQRAAMV